MEIMRHIVKNMKVYKLNFYIFLLVPLILLGWCFVYGVPELSEYNIKIKDINISIYKFIYYLAPIALCTMIYIWYFYASIYYKNIIRLKEAFTENIQYKNTYIRYLRWIKQFDFRGNWGICIIKAGFFLFWFGGFFYFYDCLFDMEIIPNSLRILPFFFLLLITLVLNFSSYYLCISFIFFIMEVSKLDLKYNKSLPSGTYGFQLLRQTAKMIYTFFLLDSFCCTIPSIAFMCIHGIGNEKLKEFPYKVKFVTGFVGAVGAGSFFGIVFLISFLLRKIYKKWKMKSLYEFHKKLLRVEEMEDVNSKDINVRDITDEIDKLQKDRMSISGQEIAISIIVGIVDIIAAIIPILVQIFDEIKIFNL